VASKCGYIDLKDCEDVVFVSLNSTKIYPKGRINNVEWHFRQKERTYKSDWYVADMPFDAILGQKSIYRYNLLKRTRQLPPRENSASYSRSPRTTASSTSLSENYELQPHSESTFLQPLDCLPLNNLGQGQQHSEEGH